MLDHQLAEQTSINARRLLVKFRFCNVQSRWHHKGVSLQLLIALLCRKLLAINDFRGKTRINKSVAPVIDRLFSKKVGDSFHVSLAGYI